MRTLLVRFVVYVCLPVMAAVHSLAAGPQIKSGFIQTSDRVRLHYLEAGKGPSLVFVPGWTCPTWIWEPQLRRFSSQYRVVALDPRSQGESEKVTEGHYPERRARDIKELIDRLRLAPAVVVGHSMAVSELLNYVGQFGTESLAGLVLVDQEIGPRPKPEEMAGFFGWIRQLSVNRRDTLEQGLPEFFFKKPQPPEYLRRLVDGAMSTPTNTALALLATGMGRDYRPMLAKLDKPVLYTITTQHAEEGELLKASVSQARVEVFENAGHVLFVDEPERFNRLLEEFARTAFASNASRE